MLNPYKEVNWKPSSQELKKFSSSMLIGFTFLAIVFGVFNILKGNQSMVFPSSLFTAGVVLFTLRFIPPLNLLAYKLVFILSCAVGIVVANLILIVFYYAVFCTICITVRVLTGRDPLRLKKPTQSNWQDYEGKNDLSRYLKQY